jgi:hypothetical protein
VREAAAACATAISCPSGSVGGSFFALPCRGNFVSRKFLCPAASRSSKRFKLSDLRKTATAARALIVCSAGKSEGGVIWSDVFQSFWTFGTLSRARLGSAREEYLN